MQDSPSFVEQFVPVIFKIRRICRVTPFLIRTEVLLLHGKTIPQARKNEHTVLEFSAPAKRGSTARGICGSTAVSIRSPVRHSFPGGDGRIRGVDKAGLLSYLTGGAPVTVKGVVTGITESRSRSVKIHTIELLEFCGSETEYWQILYDRVPTLPQSLRRDFGILPHLWQNIAHRVARTIRQ
jgi:hypothetical protein